MKNAIIILNYNDYENTYNYISTIKDYKSIHTFVVVDNNSNDNMFDKLSEIQKMSDNIYVIKSDKNGGYSYGNNFGIKFLEEKFGKNFFDSYIISNPDVYVSDEVISKCTKRLFKQEDLAIVAPRMHFADKEARRSAWKIRSKVCDIANSTRITEFLLFPFFKMGEYSKKDFKENELYVDVIAGSFFIIKSKVMQEISYFDENVFLFYEEDILASKLKKKGYKTLSINNLEFIHYDSKTIGKLMNLFKKQKILFDSRKYYHKVYGGANKFVIGIFSILFYVRKFELLFEVPIRKLVSKCSR